MIDADAIVRRAQAVFGPRLRGLFAFGSRVAGMPRSDSDLDLGVWVDGVLRRGDTWGVWIAEFENVDPTFLTVASFESPPSWLLEAVRAGVDVWFDPTGELEHRLSGVRTALDAGTYRRRLFMGLPYYERAAP